MSIKVIRGNASGRIKQVCGPNELVMLRGMMLREIISFVHVASFPKYVKLALAHTVSDPVKAHVDGFGPLLFDSIGGNASGSNVVSLDGHCRLGVAEFFKADTDWASFLAIVIRGNKFGFSSTGQDFAHDLTGDIDGSIVQWWGIIGVGRESGIVLWVQRGRRHRYVRGGPCHWR
jgi:hypothetical protein